MPPKRKLASTRASSSPGAPQQLFNSEIVLYALYLLGGAERTVHTEDIAAQVFRYPLGRQRFRWSRYPQYPDKERVAKALRRLKATAGRSFVQGRENVGAKNDRRDGWVLTPEGVDFVKAAERRLAEAIRTASGFRLSYDADAFRRRVTSSPCFRAYRRRRSFQGTPDHVFSDLLYCLPDSPNTKVRAAYEKLLATAKAINAADIVEFLEAAKENFKSFFE